MVLKKLRASVKQFLVLWKQIKCGVKHQKARALTKIRYSASSWRVTSRQIRGRLAPNGYQIKIKPSAVIGPLTVCASARGGGRDQYETRYVTKPVAALTDNTPSCYYPPYSQLRRGCFSVQIFFRLSAPLLHTFDTSLGSCVSGGHQFTLLLFRISCENFLISTL